MEITAVYIVSQVITLTYYALLSLSYLLKNRSKILIANFIAHIGQTIAMAMLGGYTGAAMSVVMFLRDLVFLVQENRKSKGKIINPKFDIIILVLTIILVILLTIFTYNGLLSLLSVIATLISTFALWQKNVKMYKLLGIIVGCLWLSYEIFIISIVGVILETILIICSVIGYIKDMNKKN